MIEKKNKRSYKIYISFYLFFLTYFYFIFNDKYFGQIKKNSINIFFIQVPQNER